MTSKTLVILAGAAALIGVGAYVTFNSRSGGVSGAPSGGTAMLFPELAAKGDGVTSISVRTGADEMVVHKIEQGGKGVWTIVSRDEYPADVEKVRGLVEALSQVKIAETKTSKPDFYQRLGVQDVDAQGSNSTLVTLRSAQEPLASVIIGAAPATRGDNPMPGPLPGVFARRAGQAQVVLLDKKVEVPKGAAEWMKTDILALESARVRSAVLVQAAEGAKEAKGEESAQASKPEETLTLTKEKAEATEFAVGTIPEGRVLRTPAAPTPIATVLSYVTIEDAAAIKHVEGLAPVSSATFRTFDGLVVNTKLYVKDGKDWLTLAAAYEAPPMPEVPAREAGANADAPADTPDPKAEAEKRYKETAERVQKEVADIGARLGPWAFQLPEFKAKQLRTRVEDMLVPVVPREPSLAPGATAPGPAGVQPPPAAPGDQPKTDEGGG